VATPHHFEKTGMVFQTNRHMVTRLQSVAGEQFADPVGALIKLAVSERSPSAGHHDGKLIRGGFCDFSGEHGDTEGSAAATLTSCP
jgi:hypothetical protein